MKRREGERERGRGERERERGGGGGGGQGGEERIAVTCFPPLTTAIH